MRSQRIPAKEKLVKDIGPDDVRVRIAGTVVHTGSGSFVLDDGTGTVEVVSDEVPESGKKVMVIARILPLTDSFEARAEVLIDAGKLDLELRKKVLESVNLYK